MTSSTPTTRTPRVLPITVEAPGAPEPRPARAGRVPRAARIVAITALAVAVAYLVWRTSSTLTVPVALLGIPLLLLEIWSVSALAADTVALWRVGESRPVAEETGEDAVAVVVPTVDEPLEVLAPVLAAATAMRATATVIVLDDGHREWLAGMCHELGIDYRVRSAPTGGLGGQLMSVLETLDNGFVVVLAPDQVPDRDLVECTLGHFADPRVALVQTASDVYNADSFDHAGDDPYGAERRMSSGLDNHSATVWRGGAAILRVADIKRLGPIPPGDPRGWISVRLHAEGRRVAYDDRVLARGRAPLDAGQFTTRARERASTDADTIRRTRWARGLRPLPRLLVIRQLGASLDAWRTLGFLLLPALVLLLGASPASGPVEVFAVLFAVTVALNLAARRSLGGARGRAGATRALLAMPVSLGAVRRLVGRGPGDTPHPTAAEASRRVSPGLWILAALNAAGLLAIITRLALGEASLPMAISLVTAAWCAVNLALLATAIARVRSRAFGGERRQAHRVDAEGHVFLDGQRTHVLDLSLRGIRVLTYAEPPPCGEYCAVTFTDPRGRPAVVTGTVVDVRRRPHAHEVRVSFDPDQTYVLGVIVAGALTPHAPAPA